ncbi:MAG: exodeoxyribonuclease III [Nitrospira sp. SB0672_bin_25]|nr:exodeoxyribonuclease III [Nitrospira sp. SB0678_bin_10]MYJ53490.1 exodeoxyribonuclease III [Nitrospira sp. SB0672_bin_25]
MKIATWNVNSINVRLPHVTAYLREKSPDVLLLQELKSTEERFPHAEIEDTGYHVAIAGQKTFNGVAIIAKQPIEVEQRTLPGDSTDVNARYLEAVIGSVRVASIYLPNGNPIDNTEKFSYKLAWMDRLIAHARTLLAYEEPLVLGGDYNVCPTDDDVYDPEGFANDALCHPETRARFQTLCYLGLTDTIRTRHPHPGVYTFWDYQAGCWNKDQGLRIDHLLLSPQAADRLVDSGVDKGPRGKEKPSDHTPVWCELQAER